MDKEFAPYQPSFDMKELGFDEPCLATYQKGLNGPIMWDYWSIELRNSTNEEDEVECTAPLYQQAFRWFREKYNLFSYIVREKGINEGKITYIGIYHKISERGNSPQNTCVSQHTYEEAELECLKKLIEIVKKK